MTKEPTASFDEKAALERARRLQEEIQQARQRRQRAVEEFDAFLRESRRSMRQPPERPPPDGPAPPASSRPPHDVTGPSPATITPSQAAPAAPAETAQEVPPASRVSAPSHSQALPTPSASPTPEARKASPPQPLGPPPAAPEPGTPLAEAAGPLSSNQIAEPEGSFGEALAALDRALPPPETPRAPDSDLGVAPVSDWPAASARTERHKPPDAGRLVRRGTAIIAPVVLVAVAVTAYRWWGPQPQVTETPRDTPVAQEAVPPRVQEAEPAATDAAPVPPAATEPATVRADAAVVLVTERQVWVRVTVDGQVAVERELPPGRQLPFDFERALTIRAGDAGAVRLIVGGRDQGVMGPAGQIRNQTIVAPVSRQ